MQRLQRGEDARRIAPVAIAKPGGDRGVLHLKGADQRQLDRCVAAGMRNAITCAKPSILPSDSVMSSPCTPTVKILSPRSARHLDHLPGITIVDVDHRGAARHNQVFEQPQLGGEIGFHGRMIVEMVARKIGESAGGNAHAVEPMLIEAVRRRFQRQMRDALARQLVERAVQFDRVGRGERAVCFALGRHHADGADAGGRRPSADQIWRVKAATDVLPLVPVTAAIVAGWRGKNGGGA